MSASVDSDNPAFGFLREAYHHLVCTLRLILPPLPSDSPDDLARRDRAAVSCIAGLCPASNAEARLAADFVACSEYGYDCLRVAQRPDTTPELAAKCRTEARSMMREAKSALRMLLKLQQERRQREADSGSCNRAERTGQCALGVMEEALDTLPAPAPPALYQPAPCRPASAQAADTGIAEPAVPPPAPEPEPAPAPLTGIEATRHRAATDPVLIAAAERYAATYPERAAAIRRTGKQPHDVRYFDPPEAALTEALIAARTPVLLALDRDHAQAAA